MKKSLFRADNEIAEIYNRHVKTIYHVCFAFMKNRADAEDMVSETFVKLIRYSPYFESGEHEKAWLIRTASNLCKNELKHWWRKRENPDDYADYPQSGEAGGILEEVLNLPDRYKTAVYLYYYDGYDSVEIAKMLKKPQSTIRSYLSEGRKTLKERLGEHDEE